MKIIDDLKSRGFWPTDQELIGTVTSCITPAFAQIENSKEARGLFAALLKLAETNTRNNQLEAKTCAYLYQMIGIEKFDAFYQIFSHALSSLFNRPAVGYDNCLQKVQAGSLLMEYPNLELISDLTMLQILFRFSEKNPELGEKVCSTGHIEGEIQIDLFTLSGSVGRKQLREALRDLVPYKKKPVEDKRKMLERLLGEHIESLTSLEQDLRGYGLDPTLGQELSVVVKQLFGLKDQVSLVRQQLNKKAQQEVQRICRVA